jgi:hypothetical protein
VAGPAPAIDVIATLSRDHATGGSPARLVTLDPDTRVAAVPGETYASIGGVQRTLRADLTAADEAGQPTDEVQARLDEVNGLRETMFKGRRCEVCC